MNIVAFAHPSFGSKFFSKFIDAVPSSQSLEIGSIAVAVAGKIMNYSRPKIIDPATMFLS